MNTTKFLKLTTLGLCMSAVSITAQAEIWSVTEVQLQVGTLDRVGNQGTADTTITTFQHAGGWEYGDNFFFIDHLDYHENNNGNFPTNDSSEMYGEWYSNFSLGKITGNDLKVGPVKDFGIIAGFNYAPEVDSWWFLPGVRFDLDLPGFNFAHLDVTAYIHQGGGDPNSSTFIIVDESSSYMVDFNWAYPFQLGSTRWSLEGHVEYIDGRNQRNNFGSTKLSSWVLAQPQLRFDISDALGGKQGRVFVGIEYQYWNNKLGNKAVDESAAQLLLVWQW